METPVLLATLGTAADHTVRAVFAANVFAAGGVKTVPSGPIFEPEDASLAHELSGGPVVCLAGSDSAYAALGHQVITALRLTGAHRVILAGRPPAELAEVVDDHFAAGEDVLQFLQRTRQHLALTGAIR
jgi:methylmalonyl-CoA mutase